MPTRLPDHATTRPRPSLDVSRRTFLALLRPSALLARFNVLPVDVALWLRCNRSALALPG